MKVFGIAATVIVSENGAESEKKQVGSFKTRRNQKWFCTSWFPSVGNVLMPEQEGFFCLFPSLQHLFMRCVFKRWQKVPVHPVRWWQYTKSCCVSFRCTTYPQGSDRTNWIKCIELSVCMWNHVTTSQVEVLVEQMLTKEGKELQVKWRENVSKLYRRNWKQAQAVEWWGTGSF